MLKRSRRPRIRPSGAGRRGADPGDCRAGPYRQGKRCDRAELDQVPGMRVAKQIQDGQAAGQEKGKKQAAAIQKKEAAKAQRQK